MDVMTQVILHPCHPKHLKNTKCRKRFKNSVVKELTRFLFFKDKKAYKFQVIRRSIQELRNRLITFIFVIVCCCCLQSRPNSNSCKGSKVSRTAETLFRIAHRRVGEYSWISGISWKRHRRNYDFILGNTNKSQGANLNHKEEWGNTSMISAAKNCCCSDTSSVHGRTVMVNQLVLVPQSFWYCGQTCSVRRCKTSQ
jgi:hypothetical protein